MITLTAVYENGVFHPDAPVDLPNGTRVEINVPSKVQPPALSAEERRRIRERVIQRMLGNPLPPESPRFRREDIYDRG